MPAMVRNHISRFETLARRLVEGSVGRLIGDEDLTFQIAAQLAHAVENSLKSEGPPTAYHIFLNPTDLNSMEADAADLELQLSHHASGLIQNSAASKRTQVLVRLVPDETTAQGAVLVEGSFERDDGGTTGILVPLDDPSLEKLQLLDAFLIVNGRRHVALDKPLIKIGRRMDNDVILDVATVSRQHAHIRWRHGRFIIFDVGSRGGVQLNGEPMTESVLAPGDLITLSEQVPLIYGEGLESRQSLPNSNGAQDTLAYSPDDD
ncbi:MAG: FhaA domain-containing protein [Chloroflexota bacterium]